MRLPNHLRRGPSGLWQFRIAVPADLRAAVGLTEIVRSTGTRDSRAAQIVAYNLSSKLLAHFSHLRAMAYDPFRFNPNDRSTWPTQRQDSFRDLVVRLPNGVVIQADQNDPKDVRAAQETARLLMAAAAPSSPTEVALESVLTPPPVPTHMAYAGDPSIRPCRLSQAVDEYLDSLVAKSAKTKPKYALALNHFRTWLAERSGFTEKDPFVHEINGDHVMKWKNALRADAVARAEAKRAGSAEQARFAADPELAKRPLDLKLRTADNYLGGLSAFFKAMQLCSRYPRMLALPTQGQNFVSKAERLNGDDKWHPFTETELIKLFDPENYQRLTKPHEYWFPLLVLLTGARREELAQLALDDVRHEGGRWIIDINDRDFRSVKSAAGVRVIPMHPMLIELGFTRYLDAVREAEPGAIRAFPYLRYDTSNGFGDVPGEAFGRYCDALGIVAPDKVLHSLRKNANDRLSTNGVDEAPRCRLVGHAYTSVNVSSYTTGVSLAMLATQVLPKLDFPELNLPALARPEGFAKVLTKEIKAAKHRRLIAERKKAREGARQEKP